MRNLLFLLSLVCTLLISCTTAEDIQKPIDEAAGVSLLGDNVKAYSNGNLLNQTRGTCGTCGTRGTRTVYGEASFQTENYNWQNPFNLIKALPEGNDTTVLKYGQIQDYCFVASDTEFDLVALYANGSYYHEVICHYQYKDTNGNTVIGAETVFDDRGLSPTCKTCNGAGYISSWGTRGGKGDDNGGKNPGNPGDNPGNPGDNNQTICTACNGTGTGNWYDPSKNSDGNNKNGIISRLNETAPATKMQLPAGTIFYFEIKSFSNLTDKTVNTCTCDGTKLYNDWYTVKALNKNKAFQSVTFALNGWTIIGLEDIGYQDGGCDRDFNDVVIALNPVQYVAEEPKVETDNGKTIIDPESVEEKKETPQEYEQDDEGNVTKKEEPTPDPDDPQGGDGDDDGDDDGDGDGDGDDDDNTGVDPNPEPIGDPVQKISNGLVETNWAVNQQIKEKGDTTNYSKLSIHVRDTTDVTVIIPIKKEYTCAPDDFYIVAKHDPAVMVYGQETTATYDFDGNIVTLTITHNDDNITITSDGINKAVLDYLRETYEDGVTFEVWTWMNSIPVLGTEEDKFQTSATIKFEDATPLYYLNRMNNSGDSNDYKFVTPDGFQEVPTTITFDECGFSYQTQIFNRKNDGE